MSLQPTAFGGVGNMNSEKSGSTSRIAKWNKKITRWFTKEPEFNYPDDYSETTATGYADNRVGDLGRNNFSQGSRKTIWYDLDEMDKTDEITSRALSIIADCTTGYEPDKHDGFEWCLEKENDKAQKILDDLKKRLNLGRQGWQITRSGVKFGEEYREVVVDDDGKICLFKHLPSWTVWQNEDENGNPLPGFEQRRDGVKKGEGIQFKRWQIISFIYGPSQGHYGTGLMYSTRRTWRRLQKLEDGMTMARLIRAYDKLKHKVPVKDSWNHEQRMKAIADYKAAMTTKKVTDSNGNIRDVNNPLTVETDIYIPDDGSGRGDVDMLEAKNWQLQNIDDLEYSRDRMLIASTVPKQYLNLGTNMKGALAGGGTSLEDIQFARNLRYNQSVLKEGLLELAATAMFFQGLRLEDFGCVIKMPHISTEDFLHTSLTKLNMAKAAQVFSQILGGMPVDIMATKFMMLDDDEKKILEKFVGTGENRAGDGSTNAAKGFTTTFDRAIGSPNGTKNDPQRKGNPTVQDVVDALTELVMLTQDEVEKSGIKFNLGYPERREMVVQSLIDSIGE